jgi:hypothetical protein
MAKLTDLVSCCADITGVPEATAREISRRLRESKLISTGKVGRYGGADMTASDGASLLTGLLVASTSSVPISDLGPVTKTYLNFRSFLPSSHVPLRPGRWNRALALPLLCGLEEGHSFKDALSAIIQSAANGDFERATKKWAEMDTLNTFRVTITVAKPRPHAEAQIEFDVAGIGTHRLFYMRPTDVKNQGIFTPNAPRKWAQILSKASGFDLRVMSALTEEAIAALGLLLHNETS